MANLDKVHPELVKRYERLVEFCWDRSWYVGVTSATRSYAEQRTLYRAWLRGIGNYAANPDQVLGASPFLPSFTVRGSYHMVQADGYSHALDLHWQQCTAEQFRKAAELFGLRQTIPGEAWHYQWWDTRGVFTPMLPEPVPTPDQFEEDEMTPTIHTPKAREAEAHTWDFTYLSVDTTQSPLGGFRCDSRLLIRRNGPAAPVGVAVFFNGVPTAYEVPEDGRTLVIRVPADGLCSVVGDVICEAREQWSRV